MSEQSWLADTRTSYDTVAVSYAEILRGERPGTAAERGMMKMFTELVNAKGGGPVADVGCGPGRHTSYLDGLGLETFGIDLSPGMIEVARRDYPGLRFEVGSMTELAIEDASLGGLLAWFTLIHIPDHEIPGVLRHFHRALRPGGMLLTGFHVGDGSRLKTEGYGGHPMKVYVHRRQPEVVAEWLREAGFVVEMTIHHYLDDGVQGGFLFGYRQA
jgi:SAM-dependent methyltransferase